MIKYELFKSYNHFYKYFYSKQPFKSWLDNLFGSKYYYNVLFYTPTNKEIFLGTAKTVSDCQTMAFRKQIIKKCQLIICVVRQMVKVFVYQNIGSIL